MPEDTEQTVDNEEQDLLSALLAGEDEEFQEEADEVEEKFAKLDKKDAKRLNALSEWAAQKIQQEECEKIIKEFLTTADEDEKDAFEILIEDDMTPSQVRKVVTKAKAKGAVARDKKATADAEITQAKKQATEAWGTVLDTTQGSPDEDDEETKLWKRGVKGDLRASAALILNHPTGK